MIVTLTISEGTLPGLDQALEELGLEVRRRPLMRVIERPAASLTAVLCSGGRFGAIAVTSPRGASVLEKAVQGLGRAARAALPTIWTSGAATSSILPVSPGSKTPERGTGSVPLARAMLAAGIQGPVLYPCSSDRRDELPDYLRAAGIEVIEVPVYDIELAGISVMLEALRDTDLILIASHRIMQAASRLGGRPGLICLGPATAQTATQLGWRPVAVAGTPSVVGVTDALQSLLFAVPGPQSSPSNPSSGR